MPVYTSAANVREALSREEAGSRGTAAALSDAKLNAQIDAAEAEINAMLLTRYVVPFEVPAPLLVKSITEDIAAYLATLTYRQGRDLGRDDPVALRYDRARQLLTKISNGNADLGITSDQETSGSIGAPVNRNAGRLFGLSDFGLGDGRRDIWGCDGWG